MAGRRERQQGKNVLSARRLWTRLSLVGAICIATMGGLYYEFRKPPIKAGANPIHKATDFTPTHVADRTNILLIGTDSRPADVSGNTDVLILCSIDDINKKIELLSIPRDTKVRYPNGSYAKINESLNIGGPSLTVNLVRELLKQPIDHYALTHFGGLVDIINTIGGIPVDVKERMFYNTGDKQYNIINLHPGYQTLTGAQALGFVRFRHDALGDIGRTLRQQEFLKALTQKLLQPTNIVHLPVLVHEFWGTMDTDMSIFDVASIATNAPNIKNYMLIHETLPGSFHDPDPSVLNDASYWIVNPQQASYAAAQFFSAGIVQANPIQDPDQTATWKPPQAKVLPTINGLNATNSSSYTNSAQ